MDKPQPTQCLSRFRRRLIVAAMLVALVAGFGVYLVINAARTTACDNVRFRTAGPVPTVHGRPPLGSGGLNHVLRQAFHGSSSAVYCDDFPDPFVLRVSDTSVSYTHLRAHETRHDLVCRLL